MGRAPCCDKASVKKGPWSPDEDRKLKEYIHKHGTGGNWIALPHKAGLKRCGKSCRLRWLNYLRPNIKHGDFSDDEDRVICNLVAAIGSRWSIIAAQLPGRTDNDIKNYWNTKLKKKLMGLRSRSSNTQQQQQQHLFFPAAAAATPPPPILGDAGTSTGTAAAVTATHDHLFSLHHLALAAPHQYSSSTSPQPDTASGGLLMFGIDQQQMPTSSPCMDDNGGPYFELCNSSGGNGAGAGVGLESFIFGGFNTMQNKPFPAGPGHNNMTGGGGGVGASLLLEHHQYMSTSCDNGNAAAAAASATCVYEHEMKPFLVVPSGSTGGGLAGGTASSLFYGEAGGDSAAASQGRFLC